MQDTGCDGPVSDYEDGDLCSCKGGIGLQSGYFRAARTQSDVVATVNGGGGFFGSSLYAANGAR